MPSSRTTYLLAVLVALAAAYLFFFEAHLQTTDELQQRAGKVLNLTADEVERLKIRRDAWTSVVVERTGPTDFRIAEPIAGAADGAAIARLLSTLEFLDSRADLDGAGADDKRLYDYGLDPPRLEIDLALAKGKGQRLVIGAEAPVGGGIYVRANGEDTIHVVDKAVLTLFDEQLERMVASAERSETEQGGSP